MKRFIEDDTIPHLRSVSSQRSKTVVSDSRPWIHDHLEAIMLMLLIFVIIGVVGFYIWRGLIIGLS